MANMNPSDGDDSVDMSIADTKVTIDVQSVDEGDIQISRGERSVTCHTTAESTRTDEQEEDCGPHASDSGDQLTTEGTQGRTVGVGSEELQEDDQHTSESSCVSHDPAILTTEDSEIADSETEGIEGYSAEGDVFEAAQSGNIVIIEKYLEIGVPTDLVDEEGCFILHHAASHGQVEVIKLLHSRGCSVDPVDRYGRTPLHLAAVSGECGSIGVLVELGSNVNHVDNEGNTPLKWSLMCERYAAKEELLKYGGVEDVDCRLGSESSDDLRRQEFVAALDEETLVDLLFQSASTGDVQTVSAILEDGCSVDAVDSAGCTALHRAASGGHVEVVGVLVERGASVDARSSDGCTPLHLAASNGNLKVVSELLRLGAQGSMTVVAAGIYGTPLHQAAMKGHEEIVSVLLDAGCPIDVANVNSDSALHYAAGSGAVEVMVVLVERGLDVNRKDDDGQTPLHWASTCGKLEAVRELLRLGAQASMTVVAGKYGTPLHLAAIKGHKEIVSVLLDAGCPIDVVDVEGGSALHYAAEGGTVGVIDVLVKRSLVDVNRKDNDGWTPLHAASAFGKLEVVRELLRLGANASMTVVAGEYGTPLHQAAMKGHEEIVSVLLDAGCPIDVANVNSDSALHYAAGSGAVEVMVVLVERGLDVNRKDDDGQTPLHWASTCGKLEAVRELLRLGAQASMTVVAGKYGTPLHLAAIKGHKEIVSVLLDAGCPIDVVDVEGGSALHYAAEGGTVGVIDVLVKRSLVDVNRKDNDGWTPLHAASAFGKLEVVRELLRLGANASMTVVAGEYGTPLHQAALKGHKEIVSVLLDAGCPIEVVNSDVVSALHYAAKSGAVEVIGVLIERGLDVNRVDKDGWTPLHVASARGKLEAVRELLRLGAKESMTVVAGTAGTPLHQAAVKGHEEIVSVLLNAGCRIDVRNSEGGSALHYAAVGGSVEVMEVLSEAIHSSKAQEMQHGSTTPKNPLDCYTPDGYTPAMLAAMVGSVEVLKLLVSKHCDISLRSGFNLSIVEHAIMTGQMSKLLDISKVFGVHAENTRILLSALQERKLLDPSKLLILGSVAGDPLVIDTLSSEESVLTEAAHQKWTTTRQLLFDDYEGIDKEAIYDQLGLPNECPLSPLHISLILLKYKTEYIHIVRKKFVMTVNDSKIFIEKLISHPLTNFTANELFPNGLSPLDVARQYNFHNIVCMIERAGGGPGMWADLPEEIKEKSISNLVSLKALLSHDTGGHEAASRIFSYLFGELPSMTSAEDDAREKILQSKPELRHIVKHVLSRLHHLDRWFDVGILLGVEEDELPTIQSDSKQDRVAYRTMLSTWLKHGRHVTWQNLFDALWDYEPGRIVEEMKKNIVEELTQSQVCM